MRTLKNLSFYFILTLLLHSCDKEENDSSVDFNIDYDSSIEINIDESDLIMLPNDTGGSHTGFPLGSTSSVYGHYVYTPSQYQSDGPEYPIIIFLHGWHVDLGNEPLENVLVDGPPRLIESNLWNPSFPFIVASPQLTTSYWEPNKVHEFIEYLIDNYQINPNRIYLTGLSLGGGACWHYVGEIEDNYAAAIVPISAGGTEDLIDNLREVPIWAFHGENDQTVDPFINYNSVPLVRSINLTGPDIRARLTTYPNLGHNAWSSTYTGDGRNISQSYDEFDVDIYDWMLNYKKE